MWRPLPRINLLFDHPIHEGSYDLKLSVQNLVKVFQFSDQTVHIVGQVEADEEIDYQHPLKYVHLEPHWSVPSNTTLPS